MTVLRAHIKCSMAKNILGAPLYLIFQHLKLLPVWPTGSSGAKRGIIGAIIGHHASLHMLNVYCGPGMKATAFATPFWAAKLRRICSVKCHFSPSIDGFLCSCCQMSAYLEGRTTRLSSTETSRSRSSQEDFLCGEPPAVAAEPQYHPGPVGGGSTHSGRQPGGSSSSDVQYRGDLVEVCQPDVCIPSLLMLKSGTLTHFEHHVKLFLWLLTVT